MMRTGNSLWFVVAWLSVPLGLHTLVGTAGAMGFQTESTSNSCTRCHSFDDVLPEDHPRDDVETVESCTNCHSREDGSVAFGRMVHWKHYTRDAFEGDCWSCHSMEEGSRFGLLDTTQGTEVEASRDKVEQMSSYFESWASSQYLDRRHGERFQSHRRQRRRRRRCRRVRVDLDGCRVRPPW